MEIINTRRSIILSIISNVEQILNSLQPETQISGGPGLENYRFLDKVFSERYNVIVRPSVCRLSVTFVHRTQAIEIFSNVSTPFGTLAIYDLSVKILRRSS